MVTRTGFEPVNDAVKGRCVKPLHQRAKVLVFLHYTKMVILYQRFLAQGLIYGPFLTPRTCFMPMHQTLI